MDNVELMNEWIQSCRFLHLQPKRSLLEIEWVVGYPQDQRLQDVHDRGKLNRHATLQTRLGLGALAIVSSS